jgi:hypothetical protein
MFGPIRAVDFLPLKSFEVFSDKGHTGGLGGSDIILYSHGVMECWSAGVMVEMKNWLVKLFLSNTPSLHYSITPIC